MAVIDEIASERQRQVATEGWTSEHDDAHDMGEMANAAACYALTPIRRAWSVPYHGSLLIWLWPWSRGWWKPAKRPSERRRELIKAGALIVAEIERLDRAAAMSHLRTEPASPSQEADRG